MRRGLAGRSHVRAWVAILSIALGVGCGGGRQGLILDDGGADFGADAGSTIEDATVSGAGAASGGVFTNSGVDAAAVFVQSGPCAAGVYQGPFMTYIGVGADGGSAGPFAPMDNGTLTIILSGERVTMVSMGGGELPTTTSTTTLDSADGGTLDGSDSLGGHFFANLTGKLDCSPDAGPPYHFRATWSNASYSDPVITLPLVGHLTADYQEAGATAAPMLVNGSIFGGGVFGGAFATDGGQPFASGSGTWSATWIAPPP